MGAPGGGHGGWARALLFALLPVAAAGGGLALAVLVAGVGGFSFRSNSLKQAFEKHKAFSLSLLAFGGWAVLSSLWSDYSDHIQAPKLALTLALGAMFAVSAVADRGAQNLTRAAGLAAFLMLALLLAIDAFGGLVISRASQGDLPVWIIESKPGRGASVLLAMSFAVAGALLAWGGRWRLMLAASSLFTSAVLTAHFHHTANSIGFWLGLGFFLLGWAAPRLGPMLASGAFAFWMLAAPMLTPLLSADPRLAAALPFSWASRLATWDYVSARILERPLFGHGLDASRAVTDLVEVHGRRIDAVSLHPHSASLQIWFETGAIGAGLAAMALIFAGRSLSGAIAGHRPASAAACATIAALGFLANISYGVWQEWLLATMFIAAAMVGSIGRRAHPG